MGTSRPTITPFPVEGSNVWFSSVLRGPTFPPRCRSKKVKHHADGPPVDVGFAVMSQTEGGEAGFSKIVVGVPFHFGPVVFDAFVRIKQARNICKRQALLKQGSSFVRNFIGDLAHGSTEIFEISCSAISCIYNLIVPKPTLVISSLCQFPDLSECFSLCDPDDLLALTA